MFGIRRNLFARLAKSRVFRRAYVKEQIKQGVPAQIRAMREARGMKQSELAELTGKAQSNIARIEDPRYGKFTLQTLLEIADAFDVWLSIEFVSFAEGLRRTERSGRAALNAPSFSEADDNWSSGLEIIRASASTNDKLDLITNRPVIVTLEKFEKEPKWQRKISPKSGQQFGLEITGLSMPPVLGSGPPTTKSLWSWEPSKSLTVR